MRNTSLILILGIAFFISFLSACGPLTPHVDVAATVNGSVNTSGIVSVNIDTSSLQAFFTTQCTNLLGPSATQAQITSCVTTETDGFFNLVGIPVPSPSPSPT